MKKEILMIAKVLDNAMTILAKKDMTIADGVSVLMLAHETEAPRGEFFSSLYQRGIDIKLMMAIDRFKGDIQNNIDLLSLPKEKFMLWTKGKIKESLELELSLQEKLLSQDIPQPAIDKIEFPSEDGKMELDTDNHIKRGQ